MTLGLRVNVLLLLIGSAFSWNSFIGGGNFDVESSDPEIIDNYVDFFANIPPHLMNLPTEKPTPVPTPEPTPKPTPKPTPTPAPVTPTPKPSKGPTPKAGRFPTPQMPPTPPPTDPRPVATRTSLYSAEWGADTNNCSGEDALPNVFFHCHEGGIINLRGFTGSMCSQVGYDRIQCTQETPDVDATVSFQCSGIRNAHLMATAEVGPNVVSDCEPHGNTVKFLNLSRHCDNHIDVNRHCNGGMAYEQDNMFYCVAPVMCTDEYSCPEMKLHPLAMSNTSKDKSCSYPAAFELTTDHEFRQSYLTSYTAIDWRISGHLRGCSWTSPPLLIKCENGGHLEFDQDYPFCKMLPGNIAKCASFAPNSSLSEESVQLAVQCAGVSESQLVLSVESLSETVDAECGPGGTVIQSVMLQRKCGVNGQHFFINHPTFCDTQDQVFSVDDKHAHCFVGNTCTYNYGCDGMQIPTLSADTGSGPYGFCTYVEY